MIPCARCERCITIHHEDGEPEYVCVCSGNCESCNRDDVPKLVKVKA